MLPTFSDKQIRLLVEWKPKGRVEQRLHLILPFLFDTGARIGEVLSVRVADLNFDDLLVRLDGKGLKQRIVPFSFELRKTLHRYVTEFNRKPDSLLFATSAETALHRRNVLRDVKMLCRSLGFNPLARTVHATGTPSPRGICAGAETSSLCSASWVIQTWKPRSGMHT